MSRSPSEPRELAERRDGAAPWRELMLRHAGIALTSVKEQFAYRFDFFLSLVITLITMTLLYYLWRAVYRNATALDLPFESLLTYVCLGQAFNFARIA